MGSHFQFKQFSIQQDECAMKVGTDGVLLGAWTKIKTSTESILDIGAGTGLIALQMAQRSEAMTIDAVESDAQAHGQCVDNFENAPWNDRLFCYHATIQEFTAEVMEVYDHIISNPPFFDNPSQQELARDRARNNAHLPFTTLIECVSKLLSPQGTFATIIPARAANHVIELAQTKNLYPKRICWVKGQPTAKTKRCLLEFHFDQQEPIETTLVIEHSRHNYTDQYLALVSEFYLKM